MTVSQILIDEAYPVIERLAKGRSSHGSFAYYTSGDIYQEVWCMCLEALDRYNPEIGPIENYLVRHVTNRLKNLKRDKYFRPGSDVASSGMAAVRINLINALPLYSDDIAENGQLLCGNKINIDPVQNLFYKETLEYIRDNIPENLRDVFEDLICNNKISSSLVSEVRGTISDILNQRCQDD